MPDNTWILRPQDAPRWGFTPEQDIWYFARVAGTFKEREGFHGCQMPEQLLGRIIRVSSHPQELVLDPFAGSGTTLAVAKKLGRRWLGIELSKDYVKRIQDRLAHTRVGDSLDGPADPVRSAPKTSAGKRKVRLRNGQPVPQLDGETERGIIAAYRETCGGHSTDFILCQPELDATFVDACRKKGLHGDAYLWNRLLLRIRKAGKLPGVQRASRQLTFEQMDEYSFASEIAMQYVSVNYAYTLDETLCSPNAAATFDEMAQRFAPGFESFQYRWAALAIRKRATQSRSLARERFGAWQKKRLPAARPLKQSIASACEEPAVYVLVNCEHALYVGETFNLKRRIEQVSTANCWMDYAPQSVRFVPAEESPLQQHGLQSALISRVKPLLNSLLLRSE